MLDKLVVLFICLSLTGLFVLGMKELYLFIEETAGIAVDAYKLVDRRARNVKGIH